VAWFAKAALFGGISLAAYLGVDPRQPPATEALAWAAVVGVVIALAGDFAWRWKYGYIGRPFHSLAADPATIQELRGLAEQHDRWPREVRSERGADERLAYLATSFDFHHGAQPSLLDWTRRRYQRQQLALDVFLAVVLGLAAGIAVRIEDATQCLATLERVSGIPVSGLLPLLGVMSLAGLVLWIWTRAGHDATDAELVEHLWHRRNHPTSST
jgi:hypothetical protein